MTPAAAARVGRVETGDVVATRHALAVVVEVCAAQAVPLAGAPAAVGAALRVTHEAIVS